MKLYKRKENDPAPLGQADPYMLKASDGRYYLYATGGPQLYTSDSLFGEWEYKGNPLHAEGQKTVWAPSVIELDGKFYMYYSSLDMDSHDDHGQTMRVAVADGPEGPFEYVKDLLPPFSIDAHTVKTPSGLYLFYCNNRYEAEDGRVGTYILCDKFIDPLTLEGDPKPIVLPTLDEEIFMRNRFKEGEDWHTIEGAFYFYYEGVHFLMYSGAAYTNPTYFIGYSTAEGSEDADLRTLPWKKHPDEHTYQPLLRSNDEIEGMGHNSVLFDGGKCYIIYHGRDMNEPRQPQDTRCARIDEMKICGKELSVIPTV